MVITGRDPPSVAVVGSGNATAPGALSEALASGGDSDGEQADNRTANIKTETALNMTSNRKHRGLRLPFYHMPFPEGCFEPVK